MIVTQAERLLQVLLMVLGLWQQGEGADITENGNYEFNSTEAEMKVAIYCEIKSSLKSLRHFHKEKCLERNNKLYTDYCGNPSNKKSKHKCLHIVKKLESVGTGFPGRQLRNLDRKDNFVCGFKKAGRFPVLYNSKESICCRGKIYKQTKNQTQACCGDSVIFLNKEICCGGRSFRQWSVEEECCEDQLYNTSTHFCYLGYVFENAEDSIVISQLRHNDRSQLEYNITDPSTNYEARNMGDDKTSVDKPQNHGTLLITLLSFSAAIPITAFILVFAFKLQRKKQASESNRQIVSSSEITMSGNSQHDIFYTNPPLVNREQMSHQSRPYPEQNIAETITSTVVGHCECTANKANNRYRRRSGESLHSHVSLKIEDFIKDSKVRSENLTENLIRDSSTQTCPPKETNQRDVFGKVFQYTGRLTRKNPFVKLKNSDAKMTLSKTDLSKHDIEVVASSHTCIPEIKQKMGIEDDCHITSPCMEYVLPGMEKLEDFAVIEMKLVKGNNEIQVWRMTSGDDGGQTFEVPVVSRFQPHLDTFCFVKNDKAFIYTKIFSVYVCTKQKTEEEIDLYGVLYAKMTCSPIQAKLTLYVVEILHVEVADYKAKLDKEEALYGMRRIDVNKVPLPDKVTDEDQLIVKLSIDDRQRWDFIKDPHNPDEEYDACNLFLHDICCQRRSVESSRCTWQMENINGQEPDIFRGHLYVKTKPDERLKRVFVVNETLTMDLVRYNLGFVRRELSKSPMCSVDQRPELHNELSYSDE